MSLELRAHPDWRYWLLLAVSAAAVLGITLHAPIPQDTSYHAFADRRTLMGVPNFWNVVSNLPFLIVGIAGLRALHKGEKWRPLQLVIPSRGDGAETSLARVTRFVTGGPRHPLYLAYATLFAGVILVCFGSAYYHSAPDNNTLTWDRLPMSAAFMAFLAIVIGEWIDPRIGRRSLPILVLMGVSSVVYWHLSESGGRGDLRPYILVQFLPLVLVPLIVLLFPAPLSPRKHIWALVGAYIAAKVFEVLDERVFSALGLLSGHTLKHLTVAAGVYSALLSLTQRQLPEKLQMDLMNGNRRRHMMS